MADKHINEREIAVEIMNIAGSGNKNINELLDMAMKKYAYISKAERAFISRLVKGTYENLICIDYIIGLYSNVKSLKIRPYIKNILRISIYQIMYMDKIHAAAVCDEAVKLTKKHGFYGLKGYVNAVLRKTASNISAIEFPDDRIKYSMPEWIMDLLEKRFNHTDTLAICEAFLAKSPLSLRINISNTCTGEVVEKLKDSGIEVLYSDFFDELIYISGFDNLAGLGVLSGKEAYIQDLGSFIVTKMAGIKQGDTVVDLCAAPGGKTIHAADILNGSGKVLAFDLSENKLRRLEENAERSGFKNIYCSINDASCFNQELEKIADVVIADLPCSGLGVIGRKPDIKYNMTPEKCENLAGLQRSILDKAALYVKDGGRLIYSTCTLNSAENEENVEYFLKNNHDFKMVDLEKCADIGFDFNEFKKRFNSDTSKKGCVQLIPTKYSHDGFFIAVFENIIK